MELRDKSFKNQKENDKYFQDIYKAKSYSTTTIHQYANHLKDINKIISENTEYITVKIE